MEFQGQVSRVILQCHVISLKGNAFSPLSIVSLPVKGHYVISRVHATRITQAHDRPPGEWLTAKDDAERRAWGEYLFDEGMEYRWAGRNRMAEAYCRAALMVDPGHADAWVHVGNTRLDEDLPEEALQNYLTAEAAALERTIGDPATYKRPFWLDLDSRPYMRALHGKGLALWRLGRKDEAATVFRQQLALNPNANQGVRFLLPELKAGLSWEESAARVEESGQL